MENFNLKQYFYEKRAQGVTVGRIAELLDISVEELMEQVEGTKRAEKQVKKDPEPVKKLEKPVEKPNPEVIKEPEKPVKETKPAEKVEDDSQSWLDD